MVNFLIYNHKLPWGIQQKLFTATNQSESTGAAQRVWFAKHRRVHPKRKQPENSFWWLKIVCVGALEGFEILMCIARHHRRPFVISRYNIQTASLYYTKYTENLSSVFCVTFINNLSLRVQDDHRSAKQGGKPTRTPFIFGPFRYSQMSRVKLK